eukprot:COSAG01_NODE_431_length_17124_cov_26.577386_21_plen_80_part_00
METPGQAAWAGKSPFQAPLGKHAAADAAKRDCAGQTHSDHLAVVRVSADRASPAVILTLICVRGGLGVESTRASDTQPK